MLKFIAREPRVKQESMRDFADFIRTTGPDKEMNVVPIIQRSGSRAAGSIRDGSMLNGITAHSPNRSSGGSNLDVLGAGANGETNTPKKSPVARGSMQAREPAVKLDGSKDLIHFIRQGPPGSTSTQSPNPKLVAPFNDTKAPGKRSTKDSDEMNSPLSSTRNSAAPSTNSKTALLDSKVGPGDGGIKKTRRRVKDPYAIDLDDEDEDLLTALPGAHRAVRQEESLIDFLRNSEPPTGNSPQALAVGGAPAGSKQANGTNGASTNGARPASNGASTRRMEVRPAGATTNAKAARMEASQNTRDLAEFLRDSGPPGSDRPGGKAAKMLGGGPGPDLPPPTLGRVGSKNSKNSAKATNGGGGKFWRRKNTVEA